MHTRAYVAIDLGAESGRVIVGSLSREATAPGAGATLVLSELHRFLHEPIEVGGRPCWNLAYLWSQIQTGLRAAGDWAKAAGVPIVSVGVDSWGVDYVLLGGDGGVLGHAHCYRDTRHAAGLPLLKAKIGLERLYQITGVQELAFNTVSQLAGAMDAGDPECLRADRILLLPDYFHWRLGAPPGNEVTNASTTQMLDATSGDWSAEVMAKVGVPARLVRTPIEPGTAIGTLRADVAAPAALPETTRIVAPATHDTASAVAGVPAAGDSWAYLSSGTWSLLGAELQRPILSERARRAGFTNERGVSGTIRFHKNLIGLWLVQEVRRDLERHGTLLDYSQLSAAAAASTAFRTRIDPFHPSLVAPGNAIEKLRALARAAGDPEPVTPGELTRCCLEALAMAYRACLDDLEALTLPQGDHCRMIHVVGGGSKNVLLNQMTADATGRRVLAGPAEATAAGNVLVQAMADGWAGDLPSLRAIVTRSFELVEYRPKDTSRWNEQYARHRAVWGKCP